MYRVSESSGGDGYGYVPGADGTGMGWPTVGHTRDIPRGGVMNRRSEWERTEYGGRSVEDWLGGIVVLL